MTKKENKQQLNLNDANTKSKKAPAARFQENPKQKTKPSKFDDKESNATSKYGKNI